MKIIHRIKEKIITKDYEITIPHFLEEMLKDKLNLEDIEQAIINGSIRRKFTRDHRGIRYEVVGRVRDGREIAIIWRFKNTKKLLLITVFTIE